MDYEYYLNTYKGKATKAAFDSYITQAADLLLIYVHRYASAVYADQDLDFFGNFSKALCYEVDCLIAYGSDAMNGMPSDANVESVTRQTKTALLCG